MIKQIPAGTLLPKKRNDGSDGRFIEDEYERVGNIIDRVGPVDIPAAGTEIKSHSIYSNSSYSQGSLTIDNIKSLKWNKTDIYKKVQKQEVVLTDPVFRVVKETINVDMTDREIQEKFEQDYDYIAKQVLQGNSSKDIYGPNKYLVGDFWGHENSVRIRIPAKSMQKIISISRTATSRNHFFE
jgi:hypothetical protein